MTMLFVPVIFPCSIDLSCPHGSDGFALTQCYVHVNRYFGHFLILLVLLKKTFVNVTAAMKVVRILTAAVLVICALVNLRFYESLLVFSKWFYQIQCYNIFRS